MAATIEVGNSNEISSLSEAVAVARAGDEIVVSCGMYIDDFVTIDKPLYIRGAGRVAPVFNATRLTPTNKGIFVVKADVRIDNITFVGMRSSFGNGPGIRQESGNLIVSRCVFRGNQNGILAGDDPNATLTVTDSEFIGNGTGDGHTHGLYVGSDMAALTVERSVFVGTISGHHLKSRARETVVKDSVFGDGASGRASYAIDIPNGGVAAIIRNQIFQDPHRENPALVNYGGEGTHYQNNSLLVEGNRFVGNGSLLSIAVRNRSRFPVLLRENHYEKILVSLFGKGSSDRSGRLRAR